MLQLENRRQNGAHAWDRDHKAYDEADPADNMNCVLASVAMVNRFYGGNLTQDRIGDEVLSSNGTNYIPRPWLAR
jgi:hypothetical protein